MENAGLYINELLAEHDCVIVPGFGGFVARPATAHFAKGGNLLLPPGKSLVFNKNLSNSDGLLANHLMQKLSVPYREADALIEKWVIRAKRQLDTNKRLELEKTGVLYLGPDDTLLFEPVVSGNHQVSSFGLAPVTTIKLELTKPIEINPTVREAKPEEKRSSDNRTLSRISLVVSAILLFSFLILVTAEKLPVGKALASLNPFKNKEIDYKKTSYNLSKILGPSGSKISEEIKNSIALKYEGNSSKVFVVSSDTVESDKTKVVKPKNNRNLSNSDLAGTFQIVVGCFAVESNAFKLIGQLHEQKIEAGISGRNPRGLYVVSLAGFSSEARARAKLSEVKQQFPNAWILVK